MKSGEVRGANSTINKEAWGINSSSIIHPILHFFTLLFLSLSAMCVREREKDSGGQNYLS